eukprot:11020626-Karenia_brevis.AAC.1
MQDPYVTRAEIGGLLEPLLSNHQNGVVSSVNTLTQQLLSGVQASFDARIGRVEATVAQHDVAIQQLQAAQVAQERALSS